MDISSVDTILRAFRNLLHLPCLRMNQTDDKLGGATLVWILLLCAFSLLFSLFFLKRTVESIVFATNYSETIGYVDSTYTKKTMRRSILFLSWYEMKYSYSVGNIRYSGKETKLREPKERVIPVYYSTKNHSHSQLSRTQYLDEFLGFLFFAFLCALFFSPLIKARFFSGLLNSFRGH